MSILSGMENPRFFTACVLLLLSLPALAGKPLDGVVRDLHVNGYASPTAAVARLKESGTPDTDAPLAERRRYYGAIGQYASMEHQDIMDAVASDALAQLENMASKEGCNACRFDITLIQAQSAISRHDIDQAARLLTDSASLPADATPEQQLQWHFLRAHLYRFQGSFDQSIAEAIPAAELAEKLGYSANQVAALSILLTVNAYLGNHERAEAVGLEGYALAEKLGYRRMMAGIVLSLSYNYARSGQGNKELEALNRALAITEGDLDLEVLRTTALSNLADYWLRKSDWSKALNYAGRAVDLAKKRDDPVTLMFALTNRGTAKGHLGNVEAGVADVKAAIATANRLEKRTDEAEITQELVGIYERAGRYREAYQTLRGIGALQSEITRQMRDKMALELQEKYSTEKRQREIERLADANKVKEAELAVKTWQQRLWATLAVMLAVAGLALTQWLKRMRNANRQLSGDVAVLAEQSAHDPLTCAFNRRQGHILLTHHSDALRKPQPGPTHTVGLMLLDLDLFKLVNDTYGHAAGDKVLVTVAQRLRGLLRAQDAVVRWGGEEFLLILPTIRASALSMLAGRVLHAIGGEPIDIGNKAITVTASAGCVAAPFGNITNMETLVELADLALYHAKSTGRNCAICVGGAKPDLDMATLGQDLAIASAAGTVQLETSLGPKAEHV